MRGAHDGGLPRTRGPVQHFRTIYLVLALAAATRRPLPSAVR